MIALLLFISSCLWAQDHPVESLEKEGLVQGLSINLDDKFSVQGGTVVNRMTIASATIHGDIAVDNTTLCVDSANSRVGVGTCAPAVALDGSGAINSTGDGTHSGNNTLSGGVNISSVNVTESAPATPLAGRIYRDRIIGGRVKFNNAGTISDDFNVSSITDNAGAGDWTVNWDLDFATANYSVVCMNRSVAGPNKGFMTQHESTAQAADSVRLLCVDNDVALDATVIYCIASGDQ